MKTVDFLETIAACGLRLGGCKQLIEFMKICQGHLHLKIKTCFSQNAGPFLYPRHTKYIGGI